MHLERNNTWDAGAGGNSRRRAGCPCAQAAGAAASGGASRHEVRLAPARIHDIMSPGDKLIQRKVHECMEGQISFVWLPHTVSVWPSKKTLSYRSEVARFSACKLSISVLSDSTQHLQIILYTNEDLCLLCTISSFML